MAPSLTASKSPLEESQRERKAIVKLTLAFIVVSLVAHWLIGAFYHPRRVVEIPVPESTIIVIWETPTPRPAPLTPTPTPKPAEHHTAPPAQSQNLQPVNPPTSRPGPTAVSQSPGPGLSTRRSG